MRRRPAARNAERHLAHLSELFSSLQGEGPRAGEPHLFVRFYGCHLDCTYCDTPETVNARQPAGFRPACYRFEATPGHGDFEQRSNPVAPAELAARVRELEERAPGHRALVLTGGEPLLHDRFLERFLPLVEPLGLPAYLETAGDLPEAWARVAGRVAIVAMDLKLPGVTADRDRWRRHDAFLAAVRATPAELFVKVVVSGGTPGDELDRAVDLVAGHDPRLPFVLQPMTPFGAARDAPSAEQLLAWSSRARRRLADVRVIPQLHKALGLL